MTDKPSESNKSTTILIILTAILIGIGGYLGYTNSQLRDELANCNTNFDSSEAEREAIQADLEMMLDQYSALETSNDSINSELYAEKAKVQKLLEDAKNNKYEIYKLRKEASSLRDIMKGYVRTIDSLNTANIELRAENAEVSQSLDEERTRNTELSEVNQSLSEKVAIGAQLRALDMVAYAQRVKNNGVHRETDRSNKAEKVKACFTLDKNAVTEPGQKTVYLRVIAPSGTVLADSESNTFDLNGSNGLYTVKKVVTYENAELDLCFFYDVTRPLTPGEYMVEAFESGVKLGTTTFTLK